MKIGTRKLYEMLEPFMLEHQIKMGRDALFNLLAINNLLIRKRRRRYITTDSSHWLRKYPNLAKGFIPTQSNQLWVSDITYWKVKNNLFYISFITDCFSHKIVGYHVAQSLEAIETLQALQMALQTNELINEQLIHHSDRGAQYCSKEYVELLNRNNVLISMTENGDPRENAVAERLNGIMKNEYLFRYDVFSINQAKAALEQAVSLYNNERPHMSIQNLTPTNIHQKNKTTQKLWKSYYTLNSNIVNE